MVNKQKLGEITFSLREQDDVQLLEHHLQLYAVDRQEPHDFCLLQN